MLVYGFALLLVVILKVCTLLGLLIIPKATPLAQLELFKKRMIKQILSLPTRTADPAVYILSGLLPVEAQIHIRAFGIFNNDEKFNIFFVFTA
jgi:hypothetical protein